MAFNSMLARFLVQEHLRSSLAGKKVLTLGRQSIYMNLTEAVAVCRSEGYEPPAAIIEKISASASVRDTDTRYGSEITDKVFFSLFGVQNLDSMDHCDYEKCTIVHDLNSEVPAEYHGKYDYIVDGGTLDHIVDIATALKNIVMMLKDGGRLYIWNACSNYTVGTYCSFSPDFFFDYFAINNFTNCRTFIAETKDMGATHDSDVYYIDPLCCKRGEKKSAEYLMLIFFAQKRSDGSSSFGKMPIVSQYIEQHAKQLSKKVAEESAGEFCLTRNPFLKKEQDLPAKKRWMESFLETIVGSGIFFPKTTLGAPPKTEISVAGYRLVARF